MGCCRHLKHCGHMNTLVLALVCIAFLVSFAFYNAGITPLSETLNSETKKDGVEWTSNIRPKSIKHMKKSITASFETESKLEESGTEQNGSLQQITPKEAEVPKTVTEKELELCPEKPKELVGVIKTLLNPVNISAVEGKYPEVTKGGNYRPQDCKPRERLALIIPCRNRTPHLHILLNNLLRLLIKQKVYFTIFVIDQGLPTTFNRGMLFNVGYMEALKRGDYDCFIFHDVDMIPTNDNCLYRCTANPRHFLSGVSKWNYRLPYNGYYGGVVAFTRDQFKKINGDSNLYFGWGGEDDDLRARILNKGYSLVRYPKFVGRYDTISHKRDSGNKENPARFRLVTTAKARQDIEGLSSTHYTVTEVVEERLYTKIKVFINMTQMIRTAPSSDWPIVSVLQRDALAFDAEIKQKRLLSQSTQNQPIK